jgi:hypothetical protein
MPPLRPHQADHVETEMIVKTPIFRGDDRVDQVPGRLLYGHIAAPHAALGEKFAVG